MPNIESILRQHTTLQVECIDRLYLNGYVPGLQRPNQLAYFLAFRSTAHRRRDRSVASFDFYRSSVAVRHYYF